MEISIGDYGRMLFETTVGGGVLPEHWESIKAEAEPLVRQLIALNQKMTNGGYAIHGYYEGEKRVLSNYQKIKQAQNRCLVLASSLQENDKFWIFDHPDFEMDVADDPLTVFEVTKKGVYFKVKRGSSTDVIDPKTKVLSLPNGVTEQFQEMFQSDDYWKLLYEEHHKFR